MSPEISTRSPSRKSPKTEKEEEDNRISPRKQEVEEDDAESLADRDHNKENIIVVNSKKNSPVKDEDNIARSPDQQENTHQVIDEDCVDRSYLSPRKPPLLSLQHRQEEELENDHESHPVQQPQRSLFPTPTTSSPGVTTGIRQQAKYEQDLSTEFRRMPLSQQRSSSIPSPPASTTLLSSHRHLSSSPSSLPYPPALCGPPPPPSTADKCHCDDCMHKSFYLSSNSNSANTNRRNKQNLMSTSQRQHHLHPQRESLILSDPNASGRPSSQMRSPYHPSRFSSKDFEDVNMLLKEQQGGFERFSNSKRYNSNNNNNNNNDYHKTMNGYHLNLPAPPLHKLSTNPTEMNLKIKERTENALVISVVVDGIYYSGTLLTSLKH